MKVYHIAMYKNAQDNIRIPITSSHDVYSDPAVTEILNKLLTKEGLTENHVISISADYTNVRDVGSWDIYVFCREPTTTSETEGETIFRLLTEINNKHDRDDSLQGKLTNMFDKNEKHFRLPGVTGRTIYMSADEVLSTIGEENVCGSMLAALMFRKGMITDQEFLDVLPYRGYDFYTKSHTVGYGTKWEGD